MTRGNTARLGVLGLVRRSFGLVYEAFGFLFPLGFAPAAALSLISYALTGGPSAAPATPDAVLAEPGFLIALAVNLVGGFAVTGVMCLAALDAAIGKRHSVGDYVAQTLRHLLPLVALGTLLSLASTLLAVFLILPGLYLLARFLPWAPAALFENAGWGGLGRAQELTKGYRWPIVGGILALGLALLLALLVFGPLAVRAEGSLLLSVLIEGVFGGLSYAVFAAFTGLVYLRLREIQEGLSPKDVAATID